MESFDWLSIVYLLLVLILIGPAVIALNRRVWLRNIAIWLAIAVAILFLYRLFQSA